MHRTLFLLSTLVLNYSVQAMDFKAIQTIHTKQIGTQNTQFKNYAKEQRKQERSLNKQKHLLDYEFADMKGALKKTTNFTAECFMENDFEELVGKPSLPEAHLNLLQVPHPVLNAVQNYNDKSNPDNKNKAFHTLFVGLPGELRHQIMANLLEGNEEAEAVFNSKPYGQSMFNLAYALEEVKNNPMDGVTPSEQLGLAIKSPEIYKLCIRMNKFWERGESPNLTPYEEHLIATGVPQVLVKKITKKYRVLCKPSYVVCQRPYREWLPTFTQGFLFVSGISVSEGLGCFIILKAAESVPITIAQLIIGLGAISGAAIGVPLTTAAFVLYDINKRYPLTLKKTLDDIIRQHNKQ